MPSKTPPPISKAQYLSVKANVTTCKVLIQKCSQQAAIYDPKNLGNSTAVNNLCVGAYGFCAYYVEYVYLYSGHNAFDIGHTTPDPEPAEYELGYFNQHWVQAALGIPFNFTYQNMVVYNSIKASGNIVRGGFLETLGNLLDHGVQVTLMYGDRDCICNWISGKRSSLAINSTTPVGFQEAGYANISTNDTYNGGVIFTHAVLHKDIATGSISIAENNNYSTIGPWSSFQIKSTMPDDPPKQCYTLVAITTCTTDQLAR